LRPEDRERADRYRFEKDRSLFVFSRMLLYRCLHDLTGRHDWALREGPHGKPEIVSAPGSPPLHFNLSHTAGLVGCALSRGHLVGFDVESATRQRDVLSIAERFFSGAEAGALRGLPAPARADAFLRLWTIKEAVTKALGGGLTIPLADFTVGLDPLTLQFARDLHQDPAQWHIEERRPTPEHRAALAVRRGAGWRGAIVWQRVEAATL
jgi:4'-phosphopantetheinyl transferase